MAGKGAVEDKRMPETTHLKNLRSMRKLEIRPKPKRRGKKKDDPRGTPSKIEEEKDREEEEDEKESC